MTATKTDRTQDILDAVDRLIGEHNTWANDPHTGDIPHPGFFSCVTEAIATIDAGQTPMSLFPLVEQVRRFADAWGRFVAHDLAYVRFPAMTPTGRVWQRLAEVIHHRDRLVYQEAREPDHQPQPAPVPKPSGPVTPVERSHDAQDHAGQELRPVDGIQGGFLEEPPDAPHCVLADGVAVDALESAPVEGFELDPAPGPDAVLMTTGTASPVMTTTEAPAPEPPPAMPAVLEEPPAVRLESPAVGVQGQHADGIGFAELTQMVRELRRRDDSLAPSEIAKQLSEELGIFVDARSVNGVLQKIRREEFAV